MVRDLRRTVAGARFYGSKSEEITSVRICRSAPLGADRMVLAEVRHGGSRDIYQLLLDEEGADVLPSRATALAARPAPLGTWHAARPWPRLDRGRAIPGEQSNTSLVLGDADAEQVILKFFRRVSPGVNPEVELLAGIGDHPNIAPLIGWCTAELPEDAGEATLAVAQAFIPDARDGWEHATGLRRRGEGFADGARALGAAIRSVHRALAGAFGSSTLPAGEVSRRLCGRLDRLLAEAPELRRHRAAARERYLALRGETPCQRVHGDLHLGQTLLRPDGGWVLIDFEGEPARPTAERRRPDAAVRDVAGMLRSLDYAAGGDDAWAAEAGAALLAGHGTGTDAFLEAYLLDKALYEVAYEINHRPDWADIPRAAVERILES